MCYCDGKCRHECKGVCLISSGGGGGGGKWFEKKGLKTPAARVVSVFWLCLLLDVLA